MVHYVPEGNLTRHLAVPKRNAGPLIWKEYYVKIEGSLVLEHCHVLALSLSEKIQGYTKRVQIY